MFGYFSDEPNSQSFPTPELTKMFLSTANFNKTIVIDKYDSFYNRVRQLMSEGSSINVHNISFPANNSNVGLAGFLDQRNFWKFGYYDFTLIVLGVLFYLV